MIMAGIPTPSPAAKPTLASLLNPLSPLPLFPPPLPVVDGITAPVSTGLVVVLGCVGEAPPEVVVAGT